MTGAARRVVNAATAAATWTTAPLAGYLSLVTLAGARPASRGVGRTATTRFAVMVPAHDEEAVIGDLLTSCSKLDYPAELFDVHVVADNCSDATVEIVRSLGWTAHERVAPGDPGKGPALNWLYDELDAGHTAAARFDAVAIVDADTVLDGDFLRAMDRAIASGAVAAQGHYTVRSPGDSTSAALRYAALACRHHLRSLGRTRLGGSCGLFGNGMAFRWELLGRHRWTGDLIEDAELQMELLTRDGIKVAYVPDALVFAEMPHSLAASQSQNERWERGRLQLAKRYLPALVRTLRSAPGRRVAAADAIADHLVPPLSVLTAGQTAVLAANSVAALAGWRGGVRRSVVAALAIAATVGHVATALAAVDAPPAVRRSLVHAPALIWWKLRLWLGALVPGRHVDWQRTPRNAEVAGSAAMASANRERACG